MSLLVSVVIPCHDQAPFITEAIQSVLAQTYTPIEVIVVDDGSTDGSAAEIERSRVRTIRLANSGVCVAVNTGIASSSGTLVMRLDGDDALAPTYVEETVRALADRPDAHFAYTGMTYFGDREGTFIPPEFDIDALAESNYVHSAALMRRASFDRVGGYREDMAALRWEDWDLWLAFAERGLSGVRVPRPLLRYRRHAGGSRDRRVLTPRGLRREVAIASRLQDHHPRLFSPGAMLRRLATLPARVLGGRVDPRHVRLLSAFYAVLLIRSALRPLRPR